MLEKYTRPEMGRIWSSDNVHRTWLQVEIAVAEAWAEVGRVPKEALPAIRSATFDTKRIRQIEEETQHDLIAFLRNLAETVGEPARWIHLGLTSQDVKDTALALQLVEAVDVLSAGVTGLVEALREGALRYKDVVMMGRTHNVHAEPITFGYKLAVWYADMDRHLARLKRVREEVAVAKIAGAVGTHANVSPEIEERVGRLLGLVVEPAGTQVIGRERHAAYVLELALLASTADKIATELRNLQHTEILEVEEPFGEGQQGSSAMPHKRNPILNERISGLARVVRGYAVPALENVVLWHERDMSNSSVERVVLPDASTLTDYLVALLTRIIRTMRVSPERMQRNLDGSHELYFSEKVLTALVEAGLSRPDAYQIVQADAMKAWRTGTSFRSIVESNSTVTSRLSTEQLLAAFDINAFLQHIDTAYQRLGLV